MENQMFITRREKLFAEMKANEVVVLFANEEPTYPRYFLQDKDFYYLTGLEIPDAILILKKTDQKNNEILLIERGIPEMEVWNGKKMKAEEASTISGIKTTKYIDEFSRFVASQLANCQTVHTHHLISSYGTTQNRQQNFCETARKTNPNLVFKDYTDLIRPLRKIKDEYEIKQLQKAINATGAGFNRIFKQAKAGMMEYELEAMLNYEVTKRGLRHMGFKSIIACGVNAATLHYVENNTKVNENDLVLCDVGAACNNYSADVTRTFPISGKFTTRQKEIYQEVLHIQKEIISMIKPGVGMVDLNKKTIELITSALKKLGLITDDQERVKYYMHSIGHHLGLDTHDVGERNSVLEAGNVITIEPGIYIEEEKIGVRIEDDILVTENGYRNLSESIPKEISDLEQLCTK